MRPKALSGSIAKYSRGLALSVLTLIGASQAPGAIYYWDNSGGTANDWGSVANWSTVIGGGTDPGAIPGVGDVATFSATPIQGTNQTVNLNADRSVLGLDFLSGVTATTTLLGGGTNRTLTLGASGITSAASNTVTIGSSTGGQNVNIIVAGSQSWANNGTGNVLIVNSVSGTGSPTLTNNGTGSGIMALAGFLDSSVTRIVQDSATSQLNMRNGTSANTFAGIVEIKKGVVSIGNGATNLGTGVGGNKVILGNSAGGSNAATLTVGDNSNQSFATPIELAANTTGLLTIRLTEDSTTASHSKTFTGGITGNNSLTIENNGGTGSNADTITFSGANQLNFTGSLTHIGTGTGDSTISSVIGPLVTGVTQNSATSRMVLSGANTFTGATTISAGILSLGNIAALQNSALDTTSSIAGDANNGLRTTVTTLTLGGLTGNKNFAATGGVFSTTSGGYGSVTALTLNPGTGVTNTYSGAIANGAANMTLTKNGLGTQVLNGANTYTGTTTINGGTLQVGGSLNGTTGTALTFGAPGGTFHVSAGSGVSQGMGALSFITGGENTVQSTNNGGNSFLTFSSMVVHANTFGTAPGTINFVVSGGTNGTDNKIVLTSVTGAGTSPNNNGRPNSFIDIAAYFNGSDFAWYDTTGYVRGINYGTDGGNLTTDQGVFSLTSTSSTGASSVSGSFAFIKITGAITNQAGRSGNRDFNTLNIAANTTFNLANNATYFTASILKSGNVAGGATFSGGTGAAISGLANSRLFIRTDGPNDTLTITIPINSSGSGALTKSGAGTLILTAANSINNGGNLVNYAGTLQLGDGGATGSVSTLTSIENYGSLVFNRNNLVAQGTVFGTIIGSGSVTQAGTSASVLSLTAANTYTGGTNIGAGTVFFTTGGLGTTGNITFTGNSTLRYGASTTTDLSSRLVMTNSVTSTIDIGVNNVTFASAFGSSTSGALTKVGSGTLTLGGANTYTGTTTINSGTLTVNTFTGSLSTSSAISIVGGTFNFDNTGAGVALTRSYGSLTLNGTVQITRTVGQDQLITFASLAARATGATGNFVTGGTPSATNGIALTSTTNAPLNNSGSNNPGLFFGGSEYARYASGGFFRATTYGTDTNALTAVATGATIGTVDATKDVKITGAITGQNTASVNTINLGANNFTITGGNTLSVNGLLSTGTLTFGAAANQGTIQPTSSGGEIVVNANAGTLTLNSVIANNTNPSTLTKTGAGTLTLGGTNSYTGGTNIGAGTLSFTTGGLGTTGNITFTGNSTLQYGALTTTDLSSRLVMSNGVTSTIDTVANNVTFASAFGSSTTGILAKAGSGTLTLGGTNTYTGGTNIGAGTISFTTGGLGTTGSITFTGNSTLQYGTSTTTDLSSRLVMTNGVTSTIDTNGNNVTFGSSIGNSTTGALTKVGSGTLALNGLTYTGNTTINQGTLTYNNGTANTSTGSLIFTGTAAYTDIGGGSTASHNFGQLNFSAGDATLNYQYAGVTGINGLTFTSLSRSAGATGNVFPSGGSLNVNQKLQITGLSANAFINAGLYFAGADFAGYGNVGGNGNTTRALNYGTDTNAAAVNTITASNHVKLTTNPASRTGDTLLTLNLAGSGVGYTMSSGTLTLSSGGLIKSGGGSLGTISGGDGVTTGASTELVIRTDVAGDSLTISTPILSSSTGGLTKSGLGTLTLSNTANAYTGVTTINAGSLLLGAAGVITDASNVTIDRAGTLNLGGNSETIGGLNGAGTVTTASGTPLLTVGASNVASATFSGVIQNGSGTVALTKTGTGTQILSGANTYTGLTTVSVGTLEVGANNALGTNAAGTSVTAGATLKLTNVNYSTTEGLIINGTGVSSGGALASSGTSTFAGLITAATSATINAISGTLELSGGLVKNGTTLTFTGAGAFTISSVISGASANSDLVVDATTVTLNAANTYNGPTTITNGGTLIANALGALPLSPRSAFTFSGSGSPTLNLGASQEVASLSSSTTSAVVNLSATGTNTLTVGAASDTTTFTGNIGGTTGSLIKDGASTQVLSGTNTYTGNTLVSAGTLQFAKQVSLYNNGAAAAWSNTNINVNSSATMAFNIGGSGEFTKTDILNLLGLANATTNGFKTGAILGLDTTSADFLFNSVIANPNSGTNVLGLTKLGTNKLTLDQANTYTGTTTVSGGKLEVTGSLSGTTAVTVNTGGTLLMNGATSNIVGNGNMTPGSGTTINGNKTGIGANAGANFTGSGGTLAVAQGAGGNGTTHSFNQMTLTANSTLDFSSGGAGNTNVNMIFASLDTATKTALFNGTTTLTINGWGNTSYLSQLGTGPYTLGTNSNPGAVDGGSFNDGQNRLIFTSDPGFGLGNFIAGINFTGFGGGATQVAFGTNQWEIVPVPEPATTALIGSIALCALVGYRERRRFTGFGKRTAARK